MVVRAVAHERHTVSVETASRHCEHELNICCLKTLMNKARMDEWMNWLRTETGTDKEVLRSREQQRQNRIKTGF